MRYLEGSANSGNYGSEGNDGGRGGGDRRKEKVRNLAGEVNSRGSWRAILVAHAWPPPAQFTRIQVQFFRNRKSHLKQHAHTYTHRYDKKGRKKNTEKELNSLSHRFLLIHYRQFRFNHPFPFLPSPPFPRPINPPLNNPRKIHRETKRGSQKSARSPESELLPAPITRIFHKPDARKRYKIKNNASEQFVRKLPRGISI